MAQILKIALGVTIGLLIFQIIIYQKTGVDHVERDGETRALQDMSNKYVQLTNAVHSYYRRHKKLPVFISDIHCRNMHSNVEKIDCAAVVKDGVFYINNKDDWLSVEPYVLDRKVHNKCKISRVFNSEHSRFRGCEKLDINSIPKQDKPDFDCGNASNEVEKIICASDKLIATEAQLSQIYNNILSVSDDDKKQQVIDDKANFIKLRSKKCKTTECIKSMTKSKMNRLELLGVKNPRLE